MPKYEVDYSFLTREGRSTIIEDANNFDDAEYQALQYARETEGDEAVDLQIEGIREII